MSINQSSKISSYFTKMLAKILVTTMIALASIFIAAQSANAITLEEATKKVEETSAVYTEAANEQSRLENEIAELTTKIDEIEAQLPELREKASDAYVSMYKSRNNTSELLDAVLGTRNLGEALYCMELFDKVLRIQTDQIDALLAAKSELDEAKAQLDEDKAVIDESVAAAKEALDEAKQARAQAQAEVLQAKGGELAAQIDWSMSREEFVAHWGARLNKYLSGTPLSGHGEDFADAAYLNGCDPRWSAAISRIESGCGAACFRPHNAWGWMGKSFSSWSDAIYAHAKYLAGPLYGGYLTMRGASTYCPPGGPWYSAVSAEMQRM